MASANCSPIGTTGLSEVIGSWKIIEISLPRTRRISRSEIGTRSRPASRTAPPMMRPGGSGSRRMTASALNDLPQPDSPTMATVSPALTQSERPSTAGRTPARVNSETCNRSISRIGAMISGPEAWG